MGVKKGLNSTFSNLRTKKEWQYNYCTPSGGSFMDHSRTAPWELMSCCAPGGVRGWMLPPPPPRVWWGGSTSVSSSCPWLAGVASCPSSKHNPTIHRQWSCDRSFIVSNNSSTVQSTKLLCHFAKLLTLLLTVSRIWVNLEIWVKILSWEKITTETYYKTTVLYRVQIQKEVISDLMRENQLLSKEIWVSTYMIDI